MNVTGKTKKKFLDFQELGKEWVKGDLDIEGLSFTDKKFELNKKQKRFVNSKKRFCLFSGGYRSGKTLSMWVKLIYLLLFFPGNQVLVGRKELSVLKKNAIPDLLDLIPSPWFKYDRQDNIIYIANGSRIVLFGLDAIQSEMGRETKKAVQKIKSLNLGAFCIDQLEEIEYVVYEHLTSRLSLEGNVLMRQGLMTVNPANHWSYNYFKKEPQPNTYLVETSTEHNRKHIPDDLIEDMLSKPESYKQKYYYGIWSPEVATEKAVFLKEHMDTQKQYQRQPLRKIGGIEIFEEPDPNQEYQIGVDPTEGGRDPSHIAVVSKDTGRKVAVYSGLVPPRVQSEKLLWLANEYTTKRKPLIILEVQGGGLALLENLKQHWTKIYEREVFDYGIKKHTKKLGWKTSHQSKQLLIDHFKKLLNNGFVRIMDEETVDEMRTFVWSDAARNKGAGADANYHDDRVMGTMLAYYGLEPRTFKEHNLLDRLNTLEEKVRKQRQINFQYI
jgi:hypothetical protein